MSLPTRRVAFLAPMQSELRPLARQLRLRRPVSQGVLHAGRVGGLEVVASMTGIGTRAAAAATERVLDAVSVDHVIVVGIAGGVGPSLALGELVVPERVVDLASGADHRPAPFGGHAARGTLATSDALIVDPDALAGLARRGVVAIDMETAAIAAVCERRGCPWSVFRAISDRAGAPGVDAGVLALAGPDGRANLPALARFLAARPARVLLLARLARDMRRATRAAASAAARALEGYS